MLPCSVISLTCLKLFESTATTVSAWASHQRGLVELLLKRGPATFQDDTSRALLTDIRGVNVSTGMYLQAT